MSGTLSSSSAYFNNARTHVQVVSSGSQRMTSPPVRVISNQRTANTFVRNPPQIRTIVEPPHVTMGARTTGSPQGPPPRIIRTPSGMLARRVDATMPRPGPQIVRLHRPNAPGSATFMTKMGTMQTVRMVGPPPPVTSKVVNVTVHKSSPQTSTESNHFEDYSIDNSTD